MILCTTHTVEGRRTVETLGLVRGNTVRARHLGKDVLAVMRNMVGGELQEYTKLMGEAREQSIDRMVAEAKALGADAVVGLRFASAEIVRGGAEFMCYGTAIKLANP